VSWLAGGGEMGALMRALDWSRTPLGPPSGWSQALRTMVGVLLRNRFPMLLWWGPRFIQLYNDAYRPIPGDKHPRSLGQPGSECWSEIWHVIGPMAEAPFSGHPATFSDDLFVLINRKGFLEETHFKVAYSPVPDETVQPTGIGGVLATVAEITEQVQAERQLRTLRELGARAGGANTAEQACDNAAATLAENTWDVPFSLVYLLDESGHGARLAAASGFEGRPPSPAAPPFIDLSPAGAGEPGWPVARALARREAFVVSDLASRFPDLPRGRWSQPPHTALVLPLAAPGEAQGHGALIVGVSPHRALEDGLRAFFELAAGQVTSAIRNALAYQSERRRAEALAELDRAKTAFFSNVSHEFRTPLTLMLGPVEDLLGHADGALAPGHRELLALVHRNGLRLKKLVNTLLDFSRIEAGRMEARYEPLDLSSFTAELASNFRSACERAGLALVVSCPPLPAPVYVDRDMWEKIVLNLISNAFKFTLRGEIAVTVTRAGDRVELAVRDTGAGIPAEALPHLFERFYRVQGSAGRSVEGSGIGLALVRELCRLHGGSIRVESQLGRGSLFTVSIPLGAAHLPAARISAPATVASTALGAAPFVEEALRWLPAPAEDGRPAEPLASDGAEEAHQPPPAAQPERGARILVADDNADLREYLTRLLAPPYQVEAVSDGVAALAAVRAAPPDLVLSDVMMPRLDGFGLLRALREDPATRALPVILLSARAGDESRIEGLEAGADDYLLKPFGARELLARVGGALALAAERSRAEAALRDADRAKSDFLAALSHELRNPLAPLKNALLILAQAAPDSDSARRAQAMMARQVDQLGRLVDDLLDVTRISRNKLQLQPERLELGDLVSRTVEDHRAEFDAAGIRLELARAPGPLFVDGDRNRLAQALGNLLQNAAKFVGRGGLATVAVGREEGELGAVIRVADTGVGVAPEVLPRLFEPFVQADETLARSSGGLGLGLALVKAIVELHGGAIAARSEGLGKGTTFTLRLPVARPAQAAAPAPAEPPALRGRRVLIIDDNLDGASSLRDVLELLFGQREVALAHTGPEGLHTARAFHPELVLCDIGLPDMDGYQIARAFRADGSLRSAHLVAVSGYAQPEDLQRAAEAGFEWHLAKPLAVDRLRDILQRLDDEEARALP
jgi:signal transduction histidine kinase